MKRLINDYLSSNFRSLSIPVTMRSIIRHSQAKRLHEEEAAAAAVGGGIFAAANDGGGGNRGEIHQYLRIMLNSDS
jgi:hypothetical protein